MSRSSRWRASELPSSGDLDVYPRTDAPTPPPAATPSSAKSRVTAKTLGLTTTERKLLPSLGVGQGLWRIKERSFVVQQQLHPAELELFDTSARASGLAPGGSTL